MPSAAFDIGLVPRDAYTPRRVDRVVHRLRERDLRHLARHAVDRHFGVDVGRAALIPAGIDRREGDLAIAVRRLDAAQIGLGRLRAVLRVVARRVDVPDLDVGVWHRRAAGVRVHDLDRQGQHACPACSRGCRSGTRSVSDGYGPTVSVGVTLHAALVLVVDVERRTGSTGWSANRRSRTRRRPRRAHDGHRFTASDLLRAHCNSRVVLRGGPLLEPLEFSDSFQLKLEPLPVAGSLAAAIYVTSH